MNSQMDRMLVVEAVRFAVWRADHSSFVSKKRSEGKIERRPLLFFRFCPEFASVSQDDPVCSRQAYAKAFDVVSIVQALKRYKERFRILLVKTGAIVAHKIDNVFFLVDQTELDPGIATFR
jgi:hypothetical protein